MGGSVTFSVWWVSRRLKVQSFGALFRSPCSAGHRGGCEEVFGILGVAVGEGKGIKICGSDTDRSHCFFFFFFFGGGYTRGDECLHGGIGDLFGLSNKSGGWVGRRVVDIFEEHSTRLVEWV